MRTMTFGSPELVETDNGYFPKHAGDVDRELPEWLINLIDYANAAKDELEYVVSSAEEAEGNAASAASDAASALATLESLIEDFGEVI